MANEIKKQNIQEIPSIKYDREQMVPDIIERKKWNLIYIMMCVIGIIATIFISMWVSKIEALKRDIASQQVRYCNYKPKVDKLKQLGQTLKINDLLVSQFMLESLYFADAKSYEIINSIKSFFNSEKVKSLVWSFEVTSVVLSTDNVVAGAANQLNSMEVIPVRIEWRYASFTDLTNMVSILKRMSPIIAVNEIEFLANNTVTFKGTLFNFKKNLFLYEYTDSYKEVNDILLAKEEFQKNKEFFDKFLEDKDLALDKMGITKIYDCKQYEDILTINGLMPAKSDFVKQCKDIETLVNDNKSELDRTFQAFIQKAGSSSANKLYVAPSLDYSEKEVGTTCSAIAPITVKE